MQNPFITWFSTTHSWPGRADRYDHCCRVLCSLIVEEDDDCVVLCQIVKLFVCPFACFNFGWLLLLWECGIIFPSRLFNGPTRHHVVNQSHSHTASQTAEHSFIPVTHFVIIAPHPSIKLHVLLCQTTTADSSVLAAWLACHCHRHTVRIKVKRSQSVIENWQFFAK